MSDEIWADVEKRFRGEGRQEIGCGPGWKLLILKLCEALDKVWKDYDNVVQGPDCWHLIQVKEKMGALVVYAEVSMKVGPTESELVRKDHARRTKLFEALIRKAHEKSVEICEDCGKEARKRFLTGAFKTLCDRCFIDWEDARLDNVK